MILHVVPLADWQADPDQPYAPASLAEEGFIHCSPDEAVTLAVINAFYRDAPDPLLVLLIDERRLDAVVRWEAADPEPPPGAAPDTVFPHVYGPINRAAVHEVRQVRRGPEGRAVQVTAWP